MGSSSETANLVVRGDDCIRTIYLRSSARLVWVVLLWFLICPAIFALDRDRTIDQFYHTAWTAKDGAPGQIRALAQTSDGFLWLGSATGLYRFDGILFERFDPPLAKLQSSDIYSLYAPHEGGLWIGYRYGGLSFLYDGILKTYGDSDSLPRGRVRNLVKDAEGTLWAAGSFGLARFDGANWQQISSEWNYNDQEAYSLLVDAKGTLWVATRNTILFLPKGDKLFQATGVQVGPTLQLLEGAEGAIWMADTTKSVRPLEIPDTNKNSAGPEIKVGSAGILIDRDGALWVTSMGDGLRRVPFIDPFRGRKIEHFSKEVEIFTEKDGLSGDYGNAIIEDREGNIWIASVMGLDRFRDKNLVPVYFPQGYKDFGLAAIPGGGVFTASTNRAASLITGGTQTFFGAASGNDVASGANCLFEDADGSVWIGGGRKVGDSQLTGLYHFKDGKITSLSPPSGDVYTNFRTIFKDPEGVLWISQVPGGLLYLKDGVWSKFDKQSELPKSDPISGAIDSLGRKWLGYPANTLSLIDGANVRTFSEKDGLKIGDVKAIQGTHGNVWIGGEFGLAFFNGDHFRTILGEGSESFRSISGIVETTEGDVWLNEARGIVRISSQEVRAVLADSNYTVRYRLFDYLDGLPGSPQSSLPYPTTVEGDNGRLWFSTTSGLVWIDPRRITNNAVPPPVSIRSLKTDEATYESSVSPQLPKGTTSLRIGYTALSLSIPERVRFRYRLEGVDKDWQDAGTRREAFYTNLGPGSYHFRVVAANNDGIWNEEGAVLEFKILPMFYQTYWFLLVCFVALACLAWAAYRFRIHQLQTRMSTQFDERLSERTRIAQDLHDTLLQGVVSAAMQLDVATERVGEKSPAKPMLDHINGLMGNVIEEGRNALKGLRSPTVNYLSDLEQRFAEVSQVLDLTGQVDFRTIVTGHPRPLLSAVGEETHQICREALTNAFRHSGATVIEVEIEYSARLFRIVVRDNGRGIDSKIISTGREGHFGLSGMRERANSVAGQFKVFSRPEGGTEAELSIPGRFAFEAHFSNIVSRWFHGRRRTKPKKEVSE